MKHALQRVAIASVLGVACATAMAQAANSQASERCEAAVAETVKRMRSKDAKDVQFTPAGRTLAREAGEDTIGVKGEGRYRNSGGTAVPFTYSCRFNARTGATSGAMFREQVAAAPQDAAVWQPDLSKVSPEACESATAAMLKDKHPFAERIQFDGSSRRLEPVANRTALDGRGSLLRAPGMKPNEFSYHCEYDPSGKVVAVNTGD